MSPKQNTPILDYANGSARRKLLRQAVRPLICILIIGAALFLIAHHGWTTIIGSAHGKTLNVRVSDQASSAALVKLLTSPEFKKEVERRAHRKRPDLSFESCNIQIRAITTKAVDLVFTDIAFTPWQHKHLNLNFVWETGPDGESESRNDALLSEFQIAVNEAAARIRQQAATQKSLSPPP